MLSNLSWLLIYISEIPIISSFWSSITVRYEAVGYYGEWIFFRLIPNLVDDFSIIWLKSSLPNGVINVVGTEKRAQTSAMFRPIPPRRRVEYPRQLLYNSNFSPFIGRYSVSTADAPMTITWPFVSPWLWLYFLNVIVLCPERGLDLLDLLLHESEDPMHGPFDPEKPISCYIVNGYFFLDSSFSLHKLTAILEPISALLWTNEMLDFRLLPCVSSLTLLSKNGVVCAPFIPCSYAYLRACWIPFSMT